MKKSIIGQYSPVDDDPYSRVKQDVTIRVDDIDAFPSSMKVLSTSPPVIPEQVLAIFKYVANASYGKDMPYRAVVNGFRIQIYNII